MNAKLTLTIAAVFGALSVILGAFGAHALQATLSDAALKTFDTGVRYQMWHSSALLFVSLLLLQFPSKLFVWAAGFFIAGIVLFSGSLYLLSFDAPRWIGIITPLGGLFFIAAWLMLVAGAIKIKL